MTNYSRKGLESDGKLHRTADGKLQKRNQDELLSRQAGIITEERREGTVKRMKVTMRKQ